MVMDDVMWPVCQQCFWQSQRVSGAKIAVFSVEAGIAYKIYKIYMTYISYKPPGDRPGAPREKILQIFGEKFGGFKKSP